MNDLKLNYNKLLDERTEYLRVLGDSTHILEDSNHFFLHFLEFYKELEFLATGRNISQLDVQLKMIL